MNQENMTEQNRTELAEAIAGYYGLQPEHVFSRSRKKEVVHARRSYLWFRLMLDRGANLSSVGREMGFDHASVLHHKTRFTDLMAIDKMFVGEMWDMVNHCVSTNPDLFRMTDALRSALPETRKSSDIPGRRLGAGFLPQSRVVFHDLTAQN